MKVTLCMKHSVFKYQSAQRDGIVSDVWWKLYMMFRGAYALALKKKTPPWP
jgi:hypothetical protein